MNERRKSRNERLKDGIETLVEFERGYATAEHGEAYNSPAEGYQVIREEVLELADNMGGIGEQLKDMDMEIRMKGGLTPVLVASSEIERLAVESAIEAIHVAAAAAKMRHSIETHATRYFKGGKNGDQDAEK